jgi:FkbM family methyltransferase
MKTKFTVSYAQNREDIVLQGFFTERKGRPGFYVDVGAGSPRTDSVTRLFYDAGWCGINLEPINHIYKALEEHRPRDTNLNIGISNEKGSLQFREYAADGFSTFSVDVQEQYVQTPDEYTVKHQDYEVQVKTLADVFAEQNITEIQFLKIDVEGYEYEVIEGNDWDKFRPEVLCIEANHIKKDWRPVLLKANYSLVYFDGLNEYYVDGKAKPEITFSYVDAVVNREPLLRYDGYDEILKEKAALKKYEDDQVFLNNHIKDLNFALQEAQNTIENMRQTRTYIKMRATKLKHRIMPKKPEDQS